MKTTVDIPDDLMERAREVAHRHKITLKTLTEEGLRLAIERLEQQKPVEIEPHVVTGRNPPPDVSWQHFREVLYGSEGAGLKG